MASLCGLRRARALSRREARRRALVLLVDLAVLVLTLLYFAADL